MYRLGFRRTNTEEEWSPGPEFCDETLTTEAMDILADRYARDGLEMRFDRIPEDEGEEQ